MDQRLSAGTFTAVVVVFAALSSACDHHYHSPAGAVSPGTIVGSGKVVVEDRPIVGVRGVELMTHGEVLIEEGASESLIVRADDNLLPHLVTEVRGGILEISSSTPFRTAGVVQFLLSVPSLDSVELSGAGSIVVAGRSTGDLWVLLAGAGRIDLERLDVGHLEIRLDGAGGIRADGEASELRVVVAGAGSYDGLDLLSSFADVEILGAGTASVWVEDELRVRISGSGSVRYLGDPTIDTVITGSGTVTRVGGGR